LVALLWFVLDNAVVGHWEQRYTPGPLATSHAMWNDRCEVCHATTWPMSEDNWLGRIADRTHAGDAACKSCHKGPRHHEAERTEDVAACTGCHIEHRGEHASLVRVPDEQCTRCHENLLAHANRKDKLPALKVTAFDGNLSHHPGFTLWDTGHLKFNHKLHMLQGIHPPGDKASFLLQDIPEPLRAGYAPVGAPKDAPVQLQCSSCHQLDAGELPPAHANSPRIPLQTAHQVRPLGAYMLPITYEVHCQACHPLTVGHLDHVFLNVPHRLELAEVRAYLTGSYAPRYLQKQAELQEKEQTRPLPGRRPRHTDPLQALAEVIQDPVARAERELYETRKGCVLCHELAPAPKSKALAGELEARQIVPTRVPALWLRNASFNHVSHRLLECRSCHARAEAYASDGTINSNASERSSDVLMPGIENCVACHSSARPSGARSDCVECHRYHNGDLPFAGKGATERSPQRLMSLD
jgi:hypothetical protein